ncbi:MAG TPA: DUF6220 domain-containing protein [Candidatus Dormibacteraeota bacterium]|jgi:hypothetical protein|nr:DUF6220 domain-containing protein [Candidatus Dormibacteraeota bacterium]
MSARPVAADPRPGSAADIRVAAWARVYSVVSVVLTLLILAQFFVAGLGVFTIMDASNPTTGSSASDSYWGLHFFNAFAILLVMLVLVGVSFLARKPRRTRLLTALLVLLILLQAVLAFVSIPPISAFHILNALLILGVTAYLVIRNWAFGRA